MKSIPPLPEPVDGAAFTLEDGSAGLVSVYVAGPDTGSGARSSGSRVQQRLDTRHRPTDEAPPLVLVHSVNAAASAAEVRPLFDRYRGSRPTYAFDLPGYGLSERSDRPYTPRLMTDAIHACVRRARADHGGSRVDVLGLSLACEFVARAAVEDPLAFRSVSLVSPTGFRGTRSRRGESGSTRAVPGLHAFLAFPLWSRALFALLTRPSVIRYFLERTWGGPTIDEALWAYDVLTTRQPGARNAPLYFLSGGLFSGDLTDLYEALTLPVWMSHGVRGDFVDYRGAKTLLARENWRCDVFATGALPYFEVPSAFFSAYDQFLAGLLPGSP